MVNETLKEKLKAAIYGSIVFGTVGGAIGICVHEKMKYERAIKKFAQESQELEGVVVGEPLYVPSRGGFLGGRSAELSFRFKTNLGTKIVNIDEWPGDDFPRYGQAGRFRNPEPGNTDAKQWSKQALSLKLSDGLPLIIDWLPEEYLEKDEITVSSYALRF
jgi:hypothetical protein